MSIQSYSLEHICVVLQSRDLAYKYFVVVTIFYLGHHNLSPLQPTILQRGCKLWLKKGHVSSTSYVLPPLVRNLLHKNSLKKITYIRSYLSSMGVLRQSYARPIKWCMRSTKNKAIFQILVEA